MSERQTKSERSMNGASSSFVVGIGASAGGLSAFEAFFSTISDTTGPRMAYVLVQHLAPDHKSMLHLLIQRYTSMPVVEAGHGMAVEVGHVYVAPAAKDLAIVDGILRLSDPVEPRGQRHSIDFFFQTLALDREESAVAVILSGLGNDGTAGAGEIKAKGGLVLVQSPDGAEFDSMPQSVIQAGWADRVMPAAEMPSLLAELAAKVPKWERRLDDSTVASLLHWLRIRTGHDFSHYKKNTIKRAIGRSMALRRIDSLDAYQAFLEDNPAEADVLFRKFLIGVTRFFRDPEAFLSLRKSLMDETLAERARRETIRAWVAGCSTGEEAYSIAILLAEVVECAGLECRVQVFATDIDNRAVATARAGVYPESIAADLAPERLARFFTPLHGKSGYQINKSIRESVVFSIQSVIKDPPFSRLDLIVCRNLLIYFDTPLQKRLLPLFHYALKPSGLLFLGGAESICQQVDLFDELDRKAKIYQRRENQHAMKQHGFTRMNTPLPVSSAGAQLPNPAEKSSFRELTEQALLDHVFMAALLVNGEGDILYQHGRAGMFLEPPPGLAGQANILKMARQGLGAKLSSALRMSAEGGATASVAGIHVKTNGNFTPVNLAVCPVAGCDPGDALYLVILEDAGQQGERASVVAAVHSADADHETTGLFVIASLREELREQKEYSREMIRRLECSNEELMCSNEEMQSVNEELQSTNEELETSREEIQSINEELASTNAELQVKIEELVTANDDMNNLLACTGIGTVFVDLHLQIRRFNPDVCPILNLIPGDLGRPMGQIASNIKACEDLTVVVRGVLETGTGKAMEIETKTGEHFLMRVSPYSSSKETPEGAVISFTDISEMVRARAALKIAGDVQRGILAVRDSRDAVVVRDLNGRILAWNPAASAFYGWSEAEALQMCIEDMIPGEHKEKEHELLLGLLQTGGLQVHVGGRMTKQGAGIAVSMLPSALEDGQGNVYAISTLERPLTKGTR